MKFHFSSLFTIKTTQQKYTFTFVIIINNENEKKNEKLSSFVN
jgi:hypothetical protein